MSARGVLLLLSWMNCCGLALWRYHSYSPYYSIFSTRSSIVLEYEGTAFVEWSVPDACSVNDKNKPNTVLRCSSPGFHTVKPIVQSPEVEEERNLLLDSSHVCFLWYYTVTNHMHNLTQELLIWIYDPESADPSELMWTSRRPSRNSVILTKQLASLGQSPIIYTTLNRKIYYPDSEMPYGAWRIEIPMSVDDILKEIRGTQVTFQDCFITDIFFGLTFPLFTMPEIPGDVPISTPPNNQIITVMAECLISSAVIVSHAETYHTNDSFHTWTRVRVPPNKLDPNLRHMVTHVALSLDGIFFLINGVLYVKTVQSFERLGRKYGLPSGLSGVVSRRWCWNKFLLKFKVSRSNIVVWTKNELYLGYDYLEFSRVLTTQRMKSSLHLDPTSAVYIHAVTYSIHPLEVALFIELIVPHRSTKRIHLLFYNEDTETIRWQDFVIHTNVQNAFKVIFLYSALPEFLVWDNHRVYYAYKNFASTGIIQTPTENGNMSKLSGDSIIHEVFADYYGDIIVKMENNVMFYFIAGTTNAIKLNLWVNSVTRTTMPLNSSGYLYLVYAYSNGTAQAHPYPLRLEVESAAFKKQEVCPYVAFQHNVYNLFYYLDKGQNLIIWGQIVYPENSGLYLIVESYGPRVFEEDRRTHYEIAVGFCTKTLLLTFYHNKNYEGLPDYYKTQQDNTGIALLHVKPNEHARLCPKSLRVFQIGVGCDTSKYLAVRGYKRDGCLQHDFYYIIRKEYLRDTKASNKRVRYTWDAYGCPLKFDIKEKFKPVIELYNENGFIEEVSVNFIVWEIHGRNDYTFNSTMAQNGCLNEAQTWKSMIARNKNTSLNNVWGPENYEHCFSYAFGKPGNLRQPYEIMNRTNYNHLVWPSDHIGLYVFRVKILDPNYSFCNLTTIFAVETSGMFPSPSVYLVVSLLFLMILVFFTILILSYFHYMRIYRQYVYNPPNRREGIYSS